MRTFTATQLAMLLAFWIPSVGLAQDTPGDPIRGASLYSNNCGRCHNLRAPNELGDQQWSIVMSHMRALAGLPGDQARDIQAFLYRSNNPILHSLPDVGTGPSDVSDIPGAQLIESNACRGCHMIGGQGGSVAPVLDTVFDRRDEKWIREQIKNPRSHNPLTVMPAMGLSDAEVGAVLEELRALHAGSGESVPAARDE